VQLGEETQEVTSMKAKALSDPEDKLMLIQDQVL